MNARENPDARRRYLAFSKTALVVLFVLAASADYVVESGDTLSDIATKHGVSTGALIEANALANPDLIRVGQVLVIPGQGGEGSGGSNYQVAPGDTLHSIASRFGTTVSVLIKANQLANPDLLGVGQQLVVPGAAVTPAPAPVAPADATSTGAVGSHTVAAGETLAGIAAKYGVSVDSIAAANGITDPSLIYVGTTLRLSGPVAPPVTTVPVSGNHVVSAGESLNALAASYGVSLSQLIETNGIADPNLIQVGQVLSIPAGGSSWSAWVCPVAGSTYFNDWGFPRSGGRFHQGNDLFADTGSPVRAPVSGTLQVKTGPVGGLQFRLYGSDGVTYIGSHLDTAIESGSVNAGDSIGTVGTTGNAAGAKPHLHFEMLPGDGLAVNPYPVLRAAGC